MNRLKFGLVRYGYLNFEMNKSQKGFGCNGFGSKLTNLTENIRTKPKKLWSKPLESKPNQEPWTTFCISFRFFMATIRCLGFTRIIPFYKIGTVRFVCSIEAQMSALFGSSVSVDMPSRLGSDNVTNGSDNVTKGRQIYISKEVVSWLSTKLTPQLWRSNEFFK